MSKKEHIASILQGMGYTPQFDEDGDLFICFQMKHVYFLLEEEDKDNYLTVMLPHFANVEEGEEGMALAVCNKMTRNLKLIKIYVDESFKTVTGTCELFYANDEALEYELKNSLRMIGMVRSRYFKTLKELS